MPRRVARLFALGAGASYSPTNPNMEKLGSPVTRYVKPLAANGDLKHGNNIELSSKKFPELEKSLWSKWHRPNRI